MGFKATDRCLAKVDEDEPIFVLRAQDKSAPSQVEGWIALNKDTLTPEHLAEAHQCARQMRTWQSAHLDRVKWPD